MYILALFKIIWVISARWRAGNH